MSIIDKIRELNSNGLYVNESVDKSGNLFLEIKSSQNVIIGLGFQLTADPGNDIHFDFYSSQFGNYYKEKHLTSENLQNEYLQFVTINDSIWYVPITIVNPRASRQKEFAHFKKELAHIANKLTLQFNSKSEELNIKYQRLSEELNSLKSDKESLDNKIIYKDAEIEKLAAQNLQLFKVNQYYKAVLKDHLPTTLSLPQAEKVKHIASNLLDYGIGSYLKDSDVYSLHYHIYSPSVLLKVTIKKYQEYEDQLKIKVPYDFFLKIDSNGNHEKSSSNQVLHDLKEFFKLKKIPSTVDDCGFFYFPV